MRGGSYLTDCRIVWHGRRAGGGRGGGDPLVAGVRADVQQRLFPVGAVVALGIADVVWGAAGAVVVGEREALVPHAKLAHFRVIEHPGTVRAVSFPGSVFEEHGVAQELLGLVQHTSEFPAVFHHVVVDEQLGFGADAQGLVLEIAGGYWHFLSPGSHLTLAGCQGIIRTNFRLPEPMNTS